MVNETACRASYEQPRIGQKGKGQPEGRPFLEFVSVWYDLEQEVIGRQLALEALQSNPALRRHDNGTLVRVGD